MNKMFLIILFLLGSSISMKSQDFKKGVITLTNGIESEGLVSIDYTTRTIFLKKNQKIESFTFDQIKSAQLDKTVLKKEEINNEIFFTKKLTKGKASLYQINNLEYLIVKVDETSRVIDLEDSRSQIAGTLSVLFSDCNQIRSSLNFVDEYNALKIIENVESYNECAYADYKPSELDIKEASASNVDIVRFYAGAGVSIQNISFFDSDNTSSTTSPQFEFGLMASPAFLGLLKGNLFLALEASAAFGSENSFSNAPSTTSFRSNTYRVVLGLEYSLNKKNAFKPFIGAYVGATTDVYNGSVGGNDFDIDGGNTIFIPRIGARYKLKNGKHLGAAISYITEYENDLRFPVGADVIPLIVNVSTITFGINYHF